MKKIVNLFDEYVGIDWTIKLLTILFWACVAMC